MIRFLVYIALLYTVLSCQEATTLDLPEGNPRLVIEGKITDQPGPYLVKVSLSTKFSEEINSSPVEDAMVTLSDDQGNQETLSMTAPGIFQSTTIEGTVGHSYTLDVTYDDITYTASSYLGPVGTIDSLISLYSPESLLRDEGYYITLYAGRSTEDQVNYYRWRLFRNDSLFNSREFLYVDSDEFGATLEGLEFGYPFDLGDTIKCEMESLTKEAYDYYIQLNALLNNDGVVNKPRYINPPTNFTPGAIGLFQTSAISTSEVIIKE